MLDSASRKNSILYGIIGVFVGGIVGLYAFHLPSLSLTEITAPLLLLGSGIGWYMLQKTTGYFQTKGGD